MSHTLNKKLEEGETFELISSGNLNPLVIVILGTKDLPHWLKPQNTKLVKCGTESWHGPRGDHPVPLIPNLGILSRLGFKAHSFSLW